MYQAVQLRKCFNISCKMLKSNVSKLEKWVYRVNSHFFQIQNSKPLRCFIPTFWYLDNFLKSIDYKNTLHFEICPLKVGEIFKLKSTV